MCRELMQDCQQIMLYCLCNFASVTCTVYLPYLLMDTVYCLKCWCKYWHNWIVLIVIKRNHIFLQEIDANLQSAIINKQLWQTRVSYHIKERRRALIGYLGQRSIFDWCYQWLWAAFPGDNPCQLHFFICLITLFMWTSSDQICQLPGEKPFTNDPGPVIISWLPMGTWQWIYWINLLRLEL